MNEQPLASTLNTFLQAGAAPNPAVTALLNDYVRYHAVLVVLGAAFILGCAVWTARFWQRARGAGWGVERQLSAALALLGVLVGLSMTLIVAANTSSVLKPRAGLSMLAQTLGHPRAGTAQARRYQAFGSWVQSGQAEVPAAIQARVQARLAWQRPKAVICGVLLLLCAALSRQLWRTLTARSRRWTWRESATLASGTLTVVAALLLTVMTMANTQAAFAPLNLTLLYG